MPYKPATLKRTAVVSSPRSAMAWASNYINEVKKHKGKDLAELGVGIGNKYFTSRPIGTISGHGYVKEEVAKIRQTEGLDGNEAVLEFLSRYCWRQRTKGRKKLGIRMILSIDPEWVDELLKARADIDEHIVDAAEITVDMVADLYYPGDELGFILAIHHDAKTFKNPAAQRRFYAKQGRLPTDADSKPHIHAHVLIMSHTRNDKRVNLSDRALIDQSANSDGRRLNRLSSIRETYQSVVHDLLSDIPLKVIDKRLDQDWAPIIHEAAMTSYEDFNKREATVEDRKVLRRRFIRRFCWHVRTMDQEKLSQLSHERQKNLLQLRRAALQSPERARASFEKEKQALFKLFEGQRMVRDKYASNITALYNPESDGTSLSFYDTPAESVQIVAPLKPVSLSYPENRTSRIKELVEELEDSRLSGRIQLVAEVSNVEMQQRAVEQNPKDPAWLTHAFSLLQSGELPNAPLLIDAPIPDVHLAPPKPAAGSRVGVPVQSPTAPAPISATPPSFRSPNHESFP